MKKIVTYTLILMYLFVGNSLFANNEREYPAVFKTTSALNVRQHPYRNSEKVGLLKKDTEIVVDSLHNARWACITHKGKVAYVATAFIEHKHPVLETSIFKTIENVRLANVIPVKGMARIAILCLLVFVAVCYIYCLSGSCRTIYAALLFVGGVGYYFGDLKWGLWATGIGIGFLFFVCLINHKLRSFWEIMTEPFVALNQLQYILQKPWRLFMKDKDGRLCKILKMPSEIVPSMPAMQRLCYRLWKIWHLIISFVFFLVQLALYIICTPLRLFNAVLYNLIVHIPCALHDYIAEVFNPKGDGMRYLGRWEYWTQYFLKLPYRFYKFLLKRSILTTLESIIYTLVDTVIPTLTMYHGTSNDAGYKITGDDDVTFKVGNGNFAGSGIYFAIAKNTAMHYAKGAIIITRVSLGRVFNVNIAPDIIRKYVAHNGRKLTDWGLRQNITTIEWWRNDSNWWEYCMLHPSGIYDTWRIRPLYIENESTGFKERIYKGMAPWLF